MIKKHSILEHITIEKLIFGGSGLATASDGRRIIISGGAIPGAVVDLRVTRDKKNHLEAQIVRTVTPSPLEKPIPPEWQLYGGCKWLPIPYEHQLRIKEQQIKEAFYPLREHTVSTVFHPIIPSPQSEHYRNKLEFSWGKYISEREGVHDEYRFGFHAPGQFDRIENCRYCVLADDEVNAIFRSVDTFARESGFDTYDPKRGSGFWRHLVVRQGKQTGQVMLVFSVNHMWDPSDPVGVFFTNMVQQLSKKYPSIRSIYFLENTGKADIVQGNPILLTGEPTITEELLGMTFEIRPKSFFQVNTLGAEKLYTRAIQSIKGKGGILLDLYAGTGTIGILLAAHFDRVYSVELVPSATEDGRGNADRNHVTNIEFKNMKVEEFVSEFTLQDTNIPVTVILDPPRDGLHPSAIEPILTLSPSEIIYVSCNPSTLVRDLNGLLATGTYRLTDVTPVDMFPHTHHIETVARLERV